MKVTVGFGENRFRMSRGSFQYRQKIMNKRKLKLTSKESIENGYILVFRDEISKRDHRIEVKEINECITIQYLGDVPNDINRFWLTIGTDEAERIYGCGETYSKLNLKGEKVRIWVAEHQNVGRITGKIIKEKLTGKHPNSRLPFHRYESYYAQPTYTSSKQYYVHADTNAYSEFDFRKPDQTTFYLQEKPHLIIESASDFTQLSLKMSNRLGRQKELPDWIYDGVILAVQQGTDTVDEKIDEALKAGIQVNGIWSQDWCGCRRTGFGYQVMWNWEQDSQLYPDLNQKILQWKQKGIRFLGYINPFIAIEKELYQEASKKGYCVKDKDGKDYLVTITTFPAAMVDFTNPAAYEWYKNLIKRNMIDIGMGGWMADFGEYLPVDSVLFSGENPELIHNRWPAIWAQMNREAIAESGKEKEVFFFTRAGHTGTIQASTMMWTGDQHVDWSVDDGIGSVIPATLSLAMSGYGITHSDAGGYTTIMHMRRSKELLMRWEEMNAFSPLLRTHEGNQPINDVQFDDDSELLTHMAKCSELHKQLKEYIKECVKEQSEQGTPVMRPLFYHYNEAAAYDEMTEYLLGRDILVAPVIKEKQEKRECYLPEDVWVHLFTKKEYTGGDYEIEAPIGQPCVFIRKQAKSYDTLIKIGRERVTNHG